MVTDAQRHKLNRDPIRDPHIALLEFQEDTRVTIHRVAANTEDVVWQGNTYIRKQVAVEFPSTERGEPRARLVVSNMDRILGRAIDAAVLRINVRLILIDFATSIALIDTKNLMVVPTASGMVELSIDLGPRASLQEPVPPTPTTKADFPGTYIA